MTEQRLSRRAVLTSGAAAAGVLALPAKVLSPQVKPKPGRPALRDIKVMKDDPVAVEAQAADIKARYQKIFGV